MREAAQSSWKPVVAAVDEFAASAAMWIAATVAKDGIFGPQAARVGSIASAVVLVDSSAEAEKTGRRVVIVRGLPGKMVPNGLEGINELGLARMQALADAGTARFIDAIAAARGIEKAAIREMNADVYEMAAAKARGLVDGVESLEGTIARAAKLARKRKRDMDQKAELRALAGLPADASDDQIEAALPAARAAVALGRDVLRETDAKSADQALLKVVAGGVALGEVEQLRAAECERAKIEEQRSRTDRLARAMQSGALTRAQAFEVTEEIGADGKPREKLTPRAAWMRGSLADLDEQLAALGAGGAPPRPRVEPAAEGEAGLAERARRSGMTLEERRIAEQNVDRGAARAATEG
jgi:ClpP class serine protease